MSKGSGLPLTRGKIQKYSNLFMRDSAWKWFARLAHSGTSRKPHKPEQSIDSVLPTGQSRSKLQVYQQLVGLPQNKAPIKGHDFVAQAHKVYSKFTE